MNILVLGGQQAGGPGLATGQGYAAQLARRIRATGRAVQVDHRPVLLLEASRLIPRLRLSTYDLILVQFDPPLNGLPRSRAGRLLLNFSLRVRGPKLFRWRALQQQLATVLVQLRSQRHLVVLLTPMPHRLGLEQRLLKAALNTVYLPHSRAWEFFVFDVSQHLTGSEIEFQAGSNHLLSAVAQEVLGSALHTFINEPSYTFWL